ncbi:hypothetical protein KC573_01905 [candidate division WWE3 bacterium]|uniref:Peptidase S24/S26A/S26B/S26C domain-containing protein n=1 Tax=candidate division WWE3 bacterium TaxID=2053526 RepID=A0A955RWY1_UNCKA|nr:hypothetical protein [candidate division WWE3 bacterium]
MSVAIYLLLDASDYPMLFKGNHTGFASPADDFAENNLDLNQHLIEHPVATFFMKLESDHEIILVIDKSKQPKKNDTVVALIEGELKIATLTKKLPSSAEIWGVVTWIIEKTAH